GDAHNETGRRTRDQRNSVRRHDASARIRGGVFRLAEPDGAGPRAWQKRRLRHHGPTQPAAKLPRGLVEKSCSGFPASYDKTRDLTRGCTPPAPPSSTVFGEVGHFGSVAAVEPCPGTARRTAPHELS